MSSAMTERGVDRVLGLANAAREVGGLPPHRLYHECVEAFREGEISFDAVTPLYRHACIHAGVVVPKDRKRFYSCPECGVELADGPVGA